MIEGRLLFRMDDRADAPKRPTLLNSIDEAFYWNEKKQGIFWTVNSFKGSERKNDECKKILAWAVDIDPSGSEEKSDLLARIEAGPRPTSVIESGRGYHVYFNADKSAKPENYSAIVTQMIRFYGGDKNAKDIARLLRPPGFLHWKDQGNPKPVKLLPEYFFTDHTFSEKEMRVLFPEPKKPDTKKEKLELQKTLSFQKDTKLFERIYSMNCKEGLERLSGHPAVGMETFTFRRTTHGNFNISVNGKGSSCWIDQNGRIGSSDGGGPTLWQYVNWYHKDHKKTFQFFKEVFPEVFK
jgi:hypothetical protein